MDARLPLRDGGSLFPLQNGLREPDIFASPPTFVVGCMCAQAQVGAVHHSVLAFATPSFEFQASVSACIFLRRYFTDVVLTFSNIPVLECLSATQVYQLESSTIRKNGRRYYRNYLFIFSMPHYHTSVILHAWLCLLH
jgi:hypothetical protein